MVFASEGFISEKRCCFTLTVPMRIERQTRRTTGLPVLAERSWNSVAGYEDPRPFATTAVVSFYRAKGFVEACTISVICPTWHIKFPLPRSTCVPWPRHLVFHVVMTQVGSCGLGKGQTDDAAPTNSAWLREGKRGSSVLKTTINGKTKTILNIA